MRRNTHVKFWWVDMIFFVGGNVGELVFMDDEVPGFKPPQFDDVVGRQRSESVAECGEFDENQQNCQQPDGNPSQEGVFSDF